MAKRMEHSKQNSDLRNNDWNNWLPSLIFSLIHVEKVFWCAMFSTTPFKHFSLIKKRFATTVAQKKERKKKW